MQAIDQVEEFKKSENFQRGILNHFYPTSQDYFLFSYGSWVNNNTIEEASFVLVNANKKICITGSSRVEVTSTFEAELGAVEIAVKVADY